MKILIIDDNVAIQEIIRDILVSEGHIVRVAGSIDEGLRKAENFLPDIIFLEYTISGDQTLSILKSDEVEIKSKVILIKSNQDKEPTDDYRIVTSINKPFTSDDVKNAVVRASTVVYKEVLEGSSERVKVENNKVRRFSFLRRKAPVNKVIDKDENFKFGTSYVIFEDRPDFINRLMPTFSMDEYMIMVITCDKAKVIRDRFGVAGNDVVVQSMGYNDRGGMLDIHKLGTLIFDVYRFLDSYTKGGKKPVIFMDNINELIEANGFDSTVRMIYVLLNKGPDVERSVIISVSDRNMSDKDRGIFLHSLTKYNTDD